MKPWPNLSPGKSKQAMFEELRAWHLQKIALRHTTVLL
jgi:hypothetical protein